MISFSPFSPIPTLLPLKGIQSLIISSINKTTEGVLQLLQELDPQKAPSPDGKFLRETPVSIAPALTLIYKASLRQGELPLDWKKVYVTPVYKKGPRTNVSD